ncbi:hypothetical protein [Rhizobium sp. FY34]|uniref:hypothetical protein n=1 Tax=Rhizobium sp. FY34 TaxID=2562309 RepID=UPI0010C0AA61|nr:hypothetical protein [Rhizobium sp. FY34]
MGHDLDRPDTLIWLCYLSAIYTCCVLATLVIHELGHALAAHWLGVEYSMSLTSVISDGGTDVRRAMIAAAGPMLSLLQGVLALVFLLLAARNSALLAQFGLVMAALGFSTAFGYLLTTPFISTGDLGKVANLLQFPLWLRILLGVVGALALTVLARWSGHAQLALLPPDWRGMPASTAFLLGGVVPWLVSIPVVLALMWPPPALLSLLFPFFAGYYLLIAWFDGPVWARVPKLPVALEPHLAVSLGVSSAMIMLAVVLRWRA